MQASSVKGALFVSQMIEIYSFNKYVLKIYSLQGLVRAGRHWFSEAVLGSLEQTLILP